MQLMVARDSEELSWPAVKCNSTVSRSMQNLMPGGICFLLFVHEAFVPMEDHGSLCDCYKPRVSLDAYVTGSGATWRTCHLHSGPSIGGATPGVCMISVFASGICRKISFGVFILTMRATVRPMQRTPRRMTRPTSHRENDLRWQLLHLWPLSACWASRSFSGRPISGESVPSSVLSSAA
jgi:hypothetical protein